MNDEQYLKLLGERIVKLRKKQGLKQLELAANLGISRTHMRRIEKGGVNCGINNLREIAQQLGISMSELVDAGK
ncbi:MAG: transcriptional regulator [Bacteroidetes bacterium]|nr:MAG: transcriptional regulator [Bacteroidota bacterium]